MPHDCFQLKSNLKGPKIYNKRTQDIRMIKQKEIEKEIRDIWEQINNKTALLQN